MAPVPPFGLPLGFTFGIDDDGAPVAHGPGGPAAYDDLADLLTRWCNERAFAVEQLAVVEDALAGRGPMVLHCDDTRVTMTPERFAAHWSVSGIDDAPTLEGSTTELRELMAAWITWLETNELWVEP